MESVEAAMQSCYGILRTLALKAGFWAVGWCSVQLFDLSHLVFYPLLRTELVMI